MSRMVRVGSRGSALALWQTEHVMARLKEAHADIEFELIIIKTQGDKILDVPLARIGDRGLFVKEIEEALIDGRIDFAVHSLKDLPTAQPEGLVIGAVSARADARDCMVSNKYKSLAEVPDGAVVGTSSLRRKAQLKALNGTWEFKDVRGNLQTRLGKLDNGEYDVLVLAAAGLQRLGLNDRIADFIAPSVSLPAVGQGALAVECRANDADTLQLLQTLEDAGTRACVTAERTLLSELEGGCQVPIGAHAVLEGDQLKLEAMVASVEGDRQLRVVFDGPMSDPISLGRRAAEELVSQGSDEILSAIRAISLP